MIKLICACIIVVNINDIGSIKLLICLLDIDCHKINFERLDYLKCLVNLKHYLQIVYHMSFLCKELNWIHFLHCWKLSSEERSPFIFMIKFNLFCSSLVCPLKVFWLSSWEFFFLSKKIHKKDINNSCLSPRLSWE